jgi:hypothetical protein
MTVGSYQSKSPLRFAKEKRGRCLIVKSLNNIASGIMLKHPLFGQMERSLQLSHREQGLSKQPQQIQNERPAEWQAQQQ